MVRALWRWIWKKICLLHKKKNSPWSSIQSILHLHILHTCVYIHGLIKYACKFIHLYKICKYIKTEELSYLNQFLEINGVLSLLMCSSFPQSFENRSMEHRESGEMQNWSNASHRTVAGTPLSMAASAECAVQTLTQSMYVYLFLSGCLLHFASPHPEVKYYLLFKVEWTEAVLWLISIPLQGPSFHALHVSEFNPVWGSHPVWGNVSMIPHSHRFIQKSLIPWVEWIQLFSVYLIQLYFIYFKHVAYGTYICSF